MTWGSKWHKGGGAGRGKTWAAKPWVWRCTSCGCGKNLWAQKCCGNCGKNWNDGWGGRRAQHREGSAWDAGPPGGLRPPHKEAAATANTPDGPPETKPSETESAALAACLEVLRRMGTPTAEAAVKSIEAAYGPAVAAKDPEKAIGPLLRKRDKKQAQLDKQREWVQQCERRLAEAKAREEEISEKLRTLQDELSEVRRLLADEPTEGDPKQPHAQTRPTSLGRERREDPGTWPTLQQQRETWKQQRQRKRRQTGPAEDGEASEGKDMDADTSGEEFGQEF
jgi:hypothetical protein